MLVSCMDEQPSAQDALLSAVEHGQVGQVRVLAPRKLGLETRNEVGGTPLISAAMSDQWVIAEILLANGADIWAYDRFGVVAGESLVRSRVRLDTPDGQARQRLLTLFGERGVPLPPPSRAKVLELAAHGDWPPRGGTH